MSKGATISVEAATRRFQGATAAVDSVSLVFPAGGVTALLGPSGSGKSTLLRMIAGLEPADEGVIRIGDTVVSAPGRSVAPEARGVGVVFQDYALFPHLTALGNVAFGVKARERADRFAEAQTWLNRVGLGHRGDAYPHALSGGEQQRVALARALASSPRAVLLDEPFSGLDPMLRASLRDVTLKALREAGATAVFVTHDADEALYVADRLAILRAGRLVQAGAPREVYDHPVSVDAAAALGPVNTAPSRVQGGRADTPFGALNAALPDGTPVTVAVRAEAVRLTTGAQAVVIERRPQGAFDLVRLEAGGLHWKAVIPARGAPEGGRLEAGASVGVTLDPDGAFVFPS